MTSTILIADDDPVQRRLLEAMVRRFGYHAETVESGEAAIARLETTSAVAIDLLILDLVMPDLDGMGVLTRMRERKIEVPAIVQTAHGSIEAVISAMRAGALDFVVKPVGAERLQVSIKNALRVDALEEELRRATRRATGHMTFKDLAALCQKISSNPFCLAMRRVRLPAQPRNMPASLWKPMAAHCFWMKSVNCRWMLR